jgi:hypothetical protein
MEWELWELREKKSENIIDWEYGKSWLRVEKEGNGLHTHTSCDDATLNCFLLLLITPGEGNEQEQEQETGKERKGKDRRDGIWTATVPACSTAHADCWGKKKDGFWQGRGEVDWDYFPIPFVLMLGVFLCI